MALVTNRKVLFKKEKVKVYDKTNGKDKGTTTTIKNYKTTEYTETKMTSNYYSYIEELKKWVKTEDIQNSELNGNRVYKERAATVNSAYTKINVYDAPNKDAKVINTISWSNKVYRVTERENGYCFFPEAGGWVLRDQINLTVLQYTANTPSAAKKKREVLMEEITANTLNDVLGIESSNSSASITASALPIKNLQGIYGAPYQFMESVDRKISDADFGRYYADRIVSRMPLLILSPGRCEFMKYASSQDRDTLQRFIADFGSDSETSAYITSPGRYYSFEYDTKSYWDYVNTMNHACSIYLGIGDVNVTINGKSAKLSEYNWENAVNQNFGSEWYQQSDTFVSFYADAESSTGEDFGNTTSESMIASTLNKSSDLGKEIRFLMGTHGTLSDIISPQKIDEALAGITEISSGLLGDNNIVTQLSREFAVVATGGKLIFPEIWSDSTFSKDFDVKIKLRCPCPNKVAWFLDICVPLNHLIAFTMPRTPSGNDLAGRALTSDVTPNGYFAPFLVRGFYKGTSSVDMGIVTSLRVDKGKEGSWTIDGLPTEVDVSMQIKDLYNAMAMTSTADGSTNLLNNTQFLSYLAFNCGISINQPDLIKSLSLWGAVFGNATYINIRNRFTLYDTWRGIKDRISNAAYDAYTGWAFNR